jgi:hypothetical protein
VLLHIGQHPAKIVATITPLMSQFDPREIRERLRLTHSSVAVVKQL